MTSIVERLKSTMSFSLFSILLGILSLAFFLFSLRRWRFSTKRTQLSRLPTVPEVPGVPLLGNLLQLKERKPYVVFTKWAEIYGPIYSIKRGSRKLVVISSSDIAKEAMETRFASISTRKLPSGLKVVTNNKGTVATSDYDNFHKMVKRFAISNVLGANAQKRSSWNRDLLIGNLLTQLHAHDKSFPGQPINFKKLFQSELFRFAMRQALGRDVESVFVDELGKTLSTEEIYKIIVLDMIEGVTRVDWRDFFPYLKWVPNKSFEIDIQEKNFRRFAVMNALIREHKKWVDSGEKATGCYLDFLLSEEGKSLTNEQLLILLWETIVAASDTTLVTTEWAMYELSKDKTRQELLYKELQSVCGIEKIKEEQLTQLPYLNGVFHETLRKHSPAPLVPIRYVHEDTQLRGYYIPSGIEIMINIYGCHMNKNQWERPEQWMPERFLDEKYNISDLQKTLAFGAGRRICAGALQANLISCVAIGKFVQEFEWSLKDGEKEEVNTHSISSHKLHPLHAIIKPRG